MSQEGRSSRMAVLLFTDMVDSVALERRLGTDAYSRLLKLHHQLFGEVLRSGRGGEIRNDTGDGLLCEFHTAAGAVEAALLFQLLLRETAWEKESPKVRIGIHQGQLAELQVNTAGAGKLVGLPVSIASRVMSLAQGGQILMTRAVYDDARQFVREHPSRPGGAPSPALQWKSHGSYSFKGSEDPVEVFEVGAAGFAPLTAPPNTEKARSAAAPALAPSSGAARKSSLVTGAVVTALCGLALSFGNIGEKFTAASYDNLFRFGGRPTSNTVMVVQMDDASATALGTERFDWDRGLQTKLLAKLTADGCRLVVFDVLFRKEKDAQRDQDLAAAMRAHGRVVLMADLADRSTSQVDANQVTQPHPKFLAAATNWGIAKLNVSGKQQHQAPVRQHWRDTAPDGGELPSLPWRAARLAGATLSQVTGAQWLRYYGDSGGLELISYEQALARPPGFFANRFVFIGSKPLAAFSDEADAFLTPESLRHELTVGGVEIHAVAFLNLLNGDWLRRFPTWAERLTLAIVGALLGAALGRCGRFAAVGAAVGLALLLTIGGVCLSYFTNYLFPWLIVVGGQLPCALVCALIPAKAQRQAQPEAAADGVPVAQPHVVAPPPAPKQTIVLSFPAEPLPDAPEYEIITPEIGKGGFGKVWIARNAIGQWQALKAVYQAKFGENRAPYEMEFKGLQRYKPVSERHPGLLRIDLVSKMKPEGYFYYVMELGDAQAPGWEKQPTLYKPKDLENLRKQAYGHRLPVKECLRVALVLADALNFLHQQGLTHRDIKPSNVIFVNGRPKLADIGLVAEIRPVDQVQTFVGTLGYMPPPPEKPGTPQADIYALGMLLYVISTGSDPAIFPDLSATLMERSGQAEFIRLNAIILKACQPGLDRRYKATSEMLNDLQGAAQDLGLN